VTLKSGKAFEGVFREALENSIELHGDDPDAVITMLNYIYGMSPYEELNLVATADELAEELLKVVEVCVIADKYCVKGLLDRVVEDFEPESDAS
jgi:hypothetical protein